MVKTTICQVPSTIKAPFSGQGYVHAKIRLCGPLHRHAALCAHGLEANVSVTCIVFNYIWFLLVSNTYFQFEHCKMVHTAMMLLSQFSNHTKSKLDVICLSCTTVLLWHPTSLHWHCALTMKSLDLLIVTTFSTLFRPRVLFNSYSYAYAAAPVDSVFA